MAKLYNNENMRQNAYFGVLKHNLFDLTNLDGFLDFFRDEVNLSLN